jgi:hypothetical protein
VVGVDLASDATMVEPSSRRQGGVRRGGVRRAELEASGWRAAGVSVGVGAGVVASGWSAALGAEGAAARGVLYGGRGNDSG